MQIGGFPRFADTSGLRAGNNVHQRGGSPGTFFKEGAAFGQSPVIKRFRSRPDTGQDGAFESRNRSRRH
jgi:hypothetical protein